MRPFAWLGLCAGLFAAAPAPVSAAPQTPVRIQLDGAVAHRGTVTVQPHARLSAGVLAASPLPSAYTLGGAWLRASRIAPQQRMQAGILFDLDALHQRALEAGDAARAQRVAVFATWIKQLPVTGRQPASSLLDGRVLELDPEHNLPLADGDHLYFPTRPASIRVVGAVHRACTLPLVPLQDARRYLTACALDADADLDTIYVIQPNGQVLVQGIALWNRSMPLSLAPGALVYVPLRTRTVAPVNPAFNSDVAAFLATQVLREAGAQ